ncbi:MAG TPA: VWA domain-containing protein [Candidatus Binatia bacterium]
MTALVEQLTALAARLGIGLTTPRALLLLAAPVLVLLAARRGTRLATVCRALALVAVALVLAGAYVERTRAQAGACVIAAVDTSASVGGAGAARARSFLARLAPALGAHDLLGSITFASRARVIARPEARRGRLDDLVPATESIAAEGDETDIAAALTAAATLCPDETQAALLLFTDGNETTGSALAEAALTTPAMPTYPLLPDETAAPPAVVRRLLAPRLAPERTTVPLEAVVENRAAETTPAVLELAANGERLTSLALDLPAGVSVVEVPYRARGAGQYLLEATIARPGAPAPTFAGARAAVAVTRPLQVLVVSEHENPVIATALAERGMHVELIAPPVFASRAGRLDADHLVVLDDVARAAFTEPALAALADWVARGGGLVATGGEHLFGDAHWNGTPLEHVLPVELEAQTPEPQEREPIALYLVIDRSNSMGYSSTQAMVHNGEKMEYAKRAALAVLDQLGPKDLVGAIAFDSLPTELGPLRPVGESRGALATKIQQLQYGGGTDFKDALDDARRHLIESGRRVKHIILLTDGDTNRGSEDHVELIAALSRAEITVTTIRIGDDNANLELLDAISRGTGGDFHHVEQVQALPQLMIRDTQRLMSNSPEREDRPTKIGTPGGLLAGFAEDDLPAIRRYALTQPRSKAEVRLYVESGDRHDPILATWQYELGRVAVIPLDFQAGAADWAAWNGFGTLWSQLARWAAPAGLAADHRLDAQRLATGTLVRLETVADEPGPFTLRLPSGADYPLRRSAPRTFTAVVPNLRSGLQSVLLLGRDPSLPEQIDLMVPAAGDGGRELAFHRPNLRLLEELARLTGGTVDPEPAAVLTARPGVVRERVPLAPVLVPLALALVLADVALRLRRQHGPRPL